MFAQISWNQLLDSEAKNLIVQCVCVPSEREIYPKRTRANIEKDAKSNPRLAQIPTFNPRSSGVFNTSLKVDDPQKGRKKQHPYIS